MVKIQRSRANLCGDFRGYEVMQINHGFKTWTRPEQDRVNSAYWNGPQHFIFICLKRGKGEGEIEGGRKGEIEGGWGLLGLGLWPTQTYPKRKLITPTLDLPRGRFYGLWCQIHPHDRYRLCWVFEWELNPGPKDWLYYLPPHVLLHCCDKLKTFKGKRVKTQTHPEPNSDSTLKTHAHPKSFQFPTKSAGGSPFKPDQLPS